MIPTVGDVVDHEDDYYDLVARITATPVDMMVALDEVGIDFEEISEYELFLALFDTIKSHDCARMVFGDLDIVNYHTEVNKQNGLYVLRNSNDGSVIDVAIHRRIANTLRTIHNMEKNTKRPGNKEGKEYMLQNAKRRAASASKRSRVSQMELLIIALVNSAQFKYDYQTVRNLSIYQFNQSVRQIAHLIDYEHIMHGVYSGTVSAKDLDTKDLSWILTK